MVPTSFDESNQVLARPPNMTAEECVPLSVWMGDHNNIPTVVSCWKVTAEELAEINKTGRVWIGIAGLTMPPIWIIGTHPWKETHSTIPTEECEKDHFILSLSREIVALRQQVQTLQSMYHDFQQRTENKDLARWDDALKRCAKVIRPLTETESWKRRTGVGGDLCMAVTSLIGLGYLPKDAK